MPTATSMLEVIFFLSLDRGFCDRNDALIQYEFNEIKTAIDYDRTGVHFSYLATFNRLTKLIVVSANVGYKSLFTTPGNLKRMRIIIAIAFFSQWSGNGIGSYYLNKILTDIGITDPTTQVPTSLI